MLGLRPMPDVAPLTAPPSVPNASGKRLSGRRTFGWRRGVSLGLRGLALLFALGAAFFAYLLWVAWVPLGKAPTGKLKARMRASPQYGDGRFENPQALYNRPWEALFGLRGKSPHSSPSAPIPVLEPHFDSSPGRLRVTWLGHSTTLIELDGLRVLTDPIFGPAASPFSENGPLRWYEPVIDLDRLQPVDVVLISHDHYDHLDQPTIAVMADWETTFVAPLGVGAHLEYWGIAGERIRHVDWWDEVQVGPLTIVCTPSRHASGRQVWDMFRTLWASYALLGPSSRVYFSGDTGFFDDLSTIGETYGPFDVTMVEVGAYAPAWPDWHMGPEQAVLAHQILKGKVFVPIHWGLFDLALHAWPEPMERVARAARAAEVEYVALKPGGQFRIEAVPPPEKWWPTVPQNKAEDDPILATRNGDPKDRYPSPWDIWAAQKRGD